MAKAGGATDQQSSEAHASEYDRASQVDLGTVAVVVWPVGRHQDRECADTFGPSRDVPDSLLKPFQRFRRKRALDVRTGGQAEPRRAMAP
jgi:hypothetical protein